MKLLSNPTSNPKISKNIKQGVLTAPLHLAPYNLSGYQVCPMASKGCIKACLNTAGRGKFTSIQEARIRRTHLFYQRRVFFMETLIKDIQALERKSIRESLSCAVRLNATSDIPWEAIKVLHNGSYHKNIMEIFPDVKFMDYTKIIKRTRKKLPNNYRLVFSQSEDNEEHCKEALDNGVNVATVFGNGFPDKWLGHRVIDGDKHDWRYGEYDEYPNESIIIGLNAKGKAKKDKSGFVKFI